MAGVKKSLLEEANVGQRMLLVAHAITASYFRRNFEPREQDEWWAMIRANYERIRSNEEIMNALRNYDRKK